MITKIGLLKSGAHPPYQVVLREDGVIAVEVNRANVTQPARASIAQNIIEVLHDFEGKDFTKSSRQIAAACEGMLITAVWQGRYVYNDVTNQWEVVLS